MMPNPATVRFEYTPVDIFSPNQYPKKPKIKPAYSPGGTESDIRPFVWIPFGAYPLCTLTILKPIILMNVFNPNTIVEPFSFSNVNDIALSALKMELLIGRLFGTLSSNDLINP